MRRAAAGWAVVVALLGGCPHVDPMAGQDAAATRDGAFVVADLGLRVDLAAATLPGNQLPLDGGIAPSATIRVVVLDGDTLQPMPATVIFRPYPGAGFADGPFAAPGATPLGPVGAVVGPGVLGFTEGVMLVEGAGDIPVPAGTYQLVATRGPEYEQAAGTVTVGAGEQRELQITLDHSVDTIGWLSADLHVHSGASFDSDILIDRRVISLVASHVEIIVPTDHNVQTSMFGEIAALGYAGQVGHVVGNEFNFDPGHAGGYPVPYDATKPNGGAFAWTAMCGQPDQGINCYPAIEAFGMIHGLMPGMTAVAINHPWWAGADLGYFTNIGWGAGTDQRTATLPSIGTFDAFEVLNAYQAEPKVVDYLVEDWFAMLDDGHRVTALGNSDSHGLVENRVGYPRNWLRLPVDAPADVTDAMLGEAVRKGRVVASTGPYLRMRVGGAEIGETIANAGGKVTVEIEVDAPDWIAVDQLRIFVNGDVVHEQAVTTGQRPRLATSVEVTVPLGADSYVVAIASSATSLPADVTGRPGIRPMAIANPVYVDGNGDGTWKPTRLRPRPLSGFDPRSVPTERVLDRDPREEQAVPLELQFDAWWAEERARY